MDIGASVNRAWEVLKSNPAVYVGGFVVVGLISLVVNAVLGLIPILGTLIGMFLPGIFIGGYMLACGKGMSGIPATFDDLWTSFKERQVDYLVAGAVMMSGAILCGIGVFLTQFLFGFAILIVAEGADWKTAINTSKELAMANVGDVAMLILVGFGLNFVGALLCGLGLFVTMPLMLLMTTGLYLELKNKQLGAGGAPGAPGAPQGPAGPGHGMY